MEHINTVAKGLNSDNDPAVQPEGTYCYGRNGTLISHGNNYYSFESIVGNTINWTMPEHKFQQQPFVPIGWYRLGDKLIIHSAEDTGLTGGAGEIGYVTFDNSGNGTYAPVYYHNDLLYTLAKMISGYGLEENDAYHRIYWTDNLNQPRTLNLANEVLTTTYTGVGDLTIGDTYMVLTASIGSATHNGIVYGPKQTAGNIFTAVNVNYTSSGNVKVIKYLDIRILNYTAEKQLGAIEFNAYTGGGQLNCGVKMYSYRLTTDDGYQSSWSYLTNPIHVAPSYPSGGYQNYQGSPGSTTALTPSTKAIELFIDSIPLYFDNIEVAVVECDQKIDVVTNIEIFWQSKITGTTMTITHVGQENLAAVALEDLGLTSAIILKAKDMTTLKQRQILVNLTEREELDWDPSLTPATVTPHIYTMPCDSQGLTVGSLGSYTYLNPSSGVVSGNILPGGHYNVSAGTTTYNGVSYGPSAAGGETFIGVDNVLTFGAPTTGSPIVKACIRIKRYEKFTASEPVYQIIELNGEYFDYKSMASHRYLAGYYRNETYRFGVVAWDKFGNPYAVRWLEDRLMQSQSDASGTYKLVTAYNTGNDESALNVLGVTIDNLDITSIADKISGISIVRCLRDKTILGQGLLLQNAFSMVNNSVVVPISGPYLDGDANVTSIGSDTTAEYSWNILGPEFDFNIATTTTYVGTNISLVAGDKIEPIADLSPLPESISGYLWAIVQGVNQAVYSKYYTHNHYTGNSASAVYINSLSVGQTVTGFMTGLDYKNHDIVTNANETQAAGGGANTLDTKGANGGVRTLVVCDVADFFNPAAGAGASGNGVSTGTFTGTDIYNRRKLLINYVRPKSSASLYGGSSDSAKAVSRYIHCNHFLKIDSTVLADIDDGAGNYILNGIEVYGGDCFVNLYDRLSSLRDEHYTGLGLTSTNGSYAWGVIFPVESTINTALRESFHFSRDGMWGTNGIEYDDGAGHRLDEKFSFNIAYISQNLQLKYDALPVGYKGVGRYPYMARYSELKNLGQKIDGMRVFLTNNFRNVDALHGEINNARVSFDRLFYWQNKGIGYLPINERETTTSPLGGSVQLGVGGVMERYDTLDKYIGNQHQFGLTETSGGWIWFDMRRKAFMYMNYDGSKNDIGTVLGLQNFFESNFPIDTGFGNIYNNDIPLLGLGIVGVFDGKETAFLTFKMHQAMLSPTSQDYEHVTDFTVLYSVSKKMFMGICDLSPGNVIEHNGRVYGVKENRFGLVNTVVYSVGDIVSKNGVNYVCIKAFTASGTPTEDPDFVGSILWVQTSVPGNVFMYGNGDICKFFGIVFPYELQLISNGNIDIEQVFDNVETYGNDTAITDVYYETELQTASDLNITSKNKNFRLIDNSWWFNTALENKKARLIGHYLKIKIVVKNYLTNPTVSLNKIKRIVYLKTIKRKKQ